MNPEKKSDSRDVEALHIEPGDDLVEALARQTHARWVHAVGDVEGAELDVGGEHLTLEGRLTLVTLTGPPSGPLMATIARTAAGRSELVGGRLLRARSLGVTSVLLGAERPAADASWATTAAAAAEAAGQSARRAATANETGPESAAPDSEEDDDESDELPRYGDRVDHFTFGLCDVMVVRDNRMKIRDVHGTGRLREVHLRVLKVLHPEVRDGKRVFKLARR